MPTSARRGLFKKCQGQGWVCTICPATHSRGRRFFPSLKAALNHERTAHDQEGSALKDDGDIDGASVLENHLQTADGPCTDHPRLTSEGLRQWEMHAHVDHVFDLVPFWQCGIDAAEKGKVLRLEEFLERMEGDGGWRTANDVLGMLGGWKSPSERGRECDGLAWGQASRQGWAPGRHGTWTSNAFGWAASQRGGWGVVSTHIASDVTGSSCGRKSGWAEGGSEVKMGWGKNDHWDARVKGAGAEAGGGGRDELHRFADVIARQEAVNEERRREMHLFFEIPMDQKIQKIEETIRFLRTHG